MTGSRNAGVFSGFSSWSLTGQPHSVLSLPACLALPRGELLACSPLGRPPSCACGWQSSVPGGYLDGGLTPIFKPPFYLSELLGFGEGCLSLAEFPHLSKACKVPVVRTAPHLTGLLGGPGEPGWTLAQASARCCLPPNHLYYAPDPAPHHPSGASCGPRFYHSVVSALHLASVHTVSKCNYSNICIYKQAIP